MGPKRRDSSDSWVSDVVNAASIQRVWVVSLQHGYPKKNLSGMKFRKMKRDTFDYCSHVVHIKLLSHLSHPFFCDSGFAAPCRPTGYILDPFWRAAKVQQPRWPWTKKFAMARNKSWQDSKNGGVLSLTYTPFWEGVTDDYETETQPLTKGNLLENFRVNFRVKDECPDLSPCHPHVSIIMSTTFWAKAVRVWEQ